MRNLIFFILLAWGLSAGAQTIRVVDNNFNAPTGMYVYTTPQAAVNDALPGDIIHIQPSPTGYGNFSVNKQLTILGIGFYLDKDFPLESSVGTITLTNASDNSTDASGTIISGLNTSEITLGTLTGPTYVLSNVVIENCLIDAIYQPSSGANIDNLLINHVETYGRWTSSNNTIYFNGYINNSTIRNSVITGGWSIVFGSASPGTNFIQNNILYGPIYYRAEGTFSNILNNVFVWTPGSGNAFNTYLRDCIVNNNIFYGNTPSLNPAGGSSNVNFQRNTFTNNIVFNTGNDEMPPSGGGAGNVGSGNQVVSPNFVSVPLDNNYSVNHDFTLNAGSPALGAGSDGTDIGISGGAYPINGNVQRYTSRIPVIQILNTSTVVNPGDDLGVRIKAQGN